MRAFIAIPIDELIKESLRDYTKGLSSLSHSIRWTKIDNIHITVKFLDEIKVELAERLALKIDEITSQHRPFELEIVGTGAFPNLKSPKVIWVGIKSSEALYRLYQDIEGLCEGFGIKKEERAFSPHITIGRVRERVSQNIIYTLITDKNRNWGVMTVKEVLLMKSILKPEGPQYSVFHKSNLYGL